ncbi:undecaprenyl-diphosphatase [Glycomyces sambucus]|uniref:Undecaprenyl-diphosphatase n=1 Tax=Glycomyces sambucus TaxID=380244 RepID=A0A1G9FX63_9ACTN|nr:phosphatase PAP2 family protein [Glycomyces sambucus]SDK92969.1 undecaprenyl-diphosphatase [Glycomyces sambucus]
MTPLIPRLRDHNHDHRLRTAAIGAACVAAVLLTAIALGDRALPLDLWIVDNLYAAPDSTLGTVAAAVSGLGTLAGAGILIAETAVRLRRERRRALGPLLKAGAVLVLCVAAIGLQALFQRSGPAVTDQDWTYPSGHVTLLAAIAFTAAVVSAHRSRAGRTAVLATGGALVAAVAAGRVVSGEHYLIDVVAAAVAVLGIGLLAGAALGLVPNAARPRPSR